MLSVLGPFRARVGQTRAAADAGALVRRLGRDAGRARARRRACRDGVVGILYMGASVVPVDESVHSFFQAKDKSIDMPSFRR